MLLDAVWPDVVVSDSMPATCVTELRRKLGDDARTPQFIETVHRRGYRFIAQVTTSATAPETPRQPSQEKKPQQPLMVGRERELAQLQGWYAGVLDGQRRILFVTGEAGIGKTTMVQSFLEAIAAESEVLIGRGQCIKQYGSGEPYMPVLEALSQLGREAGSGEVVELLGRFAPTWLAQMPELLTREERARLLNEIQGVTQQRMLREMTHALGALAAATPVVLLLEDLHWSDFSTLELIAAVARVDASARLLIIGTYRPVEILAKDHPLRTMKQELALHHYCEELRLRPLSGEDVANYLVKRLASGGSQGFRTLAPVIFAHTDGNPLFMVNMVDYLLRDAGLRTRSREVSEAEWAETLRTHRLDALRGIRQMIERNLERLTPEEQAVLEGASVVGAEFSAAAVAAALERPQHEVEASCARLSRSEQFVSEQAPIVWPDGTVAAGFRFHHVLYQEVLYSRLPAGRQIQLHRRIALREEGGYGERAAEVATELANHYRRANDKDKAVQYFRLAGERAVARGATVEAERHYVEALGLLATTPENDERNHRELELLLAAGPVLIAVRGYASPEVERAYARARLLCERTGDPTRLFPALYGLWVLNLNRGAFIETGLLAEQLLQRAQSAADPKMLLYARYAMGNTAFWRGEFLPAKDHLGSAMALYDPAFHRPLTSRYFPVDAKVICLAYTAWTLWFLGYPDRALNTVSEALALARTLSHGFSLGLAEISSAVLSQLRGETTLAQANAESGIAVAAEHQLSDFTAWATALRGWAIAKQGRHEEGIAQLEEGLTTLRETGSELLRPYILPLLAETYGAIGRTDDGLNTLTEALVAANEHEVRNYEAETYRLKGELLLRQDGFKAAEPQKCFERAIEIARKQSAKSFELRATISLVSLFNQQGNREESGRMLGAIYAWFTEGFDTPDLKDAQALLGELSNERDARLHS
jgi:predicted ATPase